MKQENSIMRGINSIVFDLDDTLYPELAYVRSGFKVVAGYLSTDKAEQSRIFDMMWEIFSLGRRERVFNEVLSRMGRSENQQLIDKLVNIYHTHKPQLELADEIRDVLQRLHKRYKLGLLTDGYLPAQRLKVEALGLDKSFDAIIYTEELGREFWKPSPRPFQRMTELLVCRHAECVYIADNPSKDFLAPNMLGWQTVQIKRPEQVHHPEKIPAGGHPRYVINQAAELAKLDFLEY